MKVLHINTNEESLLVDKLIKEGKDVFILVHMEKCGPCEATLPEWLKLEHTLKKTYSDDDNLILIDLNMKFLGNVHNIGPIDGFPTLKYISNNGQLIETYEDSNISLKDRSVDSFISWIDSKKHNIIVGGSSSKDVYERLKSLLTSKTRVHKKKETSHKTHKKGGNVRVHKNKGTSHKTHKKGGNVRVYKKKGVSHKTHKKK